MNAKDLTPESRFFGLFVGRYDTGKTTAACGFPGPVLDLDFDGRIDSMRGQNIEFERFDVRKGFAEADKYIEMLLLKSKTHQLNYKTVVVDSLSSITDFLITDAMKFTGKDEDSGKERGRRIGSLQMPTIQDFGYESEALRQIVYEGLKPLACNVIMTAHVVEKYKKVQLNPKGPVESVPDGEKILGRDKIVAKLPIYFNEIYYFEKVVEPNGLVRRYVEFDGDVARTTFPALAAKQRIEITGKNFYQEWLSIVKPEVKTEAK